MSKLFYSGNVSDVSGYRTMFVDTRNPNPPAAIATFVTDTTSGGDNIEMTATAGGTATNFITKPFAADRAIDSVMFVNTWALESNASANATIGVRLAEYTTSEQANFHDVDDGTEVTTTAALRRWASSAISSTTIDDGNRLVVDMRVVPVGTMGASQTLTFDFDTDGNDEDGDSYLQISELIEVDETQYGNGTMVNSPGVSTGYYQDLLALLNSAIAREIISEDSTIRAAVDELEFERDKGL